MQTLDLSGESRKTDNWLKSLFWPSVENAWDVDYLGQQGFWVCFVIGMLNFGLLAFMAFEMPVISIRIVLFAIGILAFFVYWVGGMGVREHSFTAALAVFITYVIGVLAQASLPGIIPIMIGAVLLSNGRATFLASRWNPSSEDENRPMRFNETLRDKLVDQIPPKAWPILKFPFYFAACLMLLLLVFGGAVNLVNKRIHPPPRTVVVTPSDSQ
jgi:hypothetical protein